MAGIGNYILSVFKNVSVASKQVSIFGNKYSKRPQKKRHSYIISEQTFLRVCKAYICIGQEFEQICSSVASKSEWVDNPILQYSIELTD